LVIDCARINSEPVGSGEAAFKYLAPYIFRVAISINRILKLEDGFVTFEYKESASDKIKTCTLSAEEFIRRFLQHVLPDRFVKVRYYGLMSPTHRDLLEELKDQLSASESQYAANQNQAIVKEPPEPLKCQRCGGKMRLVETIKANSREPP